MHISNAGFIRWKVNCDKKEECERYKAFVDFKGDTSKTGIATGLWLVNVSNCVDHNYCDSVFLTKKEKKR